MSKFCSRDLKCIYETNQYLPSWSYNVIKKADNKQKTKMYNILDDVLNRRTIYTIREGKYNDSV